jgi:diacylglycerol kinase family enzyme
VERRLQLVVNPSAGGGRAAKVLPSVEAALRGAGHDLVVTPTRSLEHADELAAAALDDERVVVAMGGDGIVGRVAATVSARSGLLGVLPGGRGNDFCRTVDIPRDPVAACAVLSDGVERALDLGVVTPADGREAVFLGIASVGFDSAVQERVLVSKRAARPARLPLRRPRDRRVLEARRLHVRGRRRAAAGARVVGGREQLRHVRRRHAPGPDASLEDGRLDVVTSGATSRLPSCRALPKVFNGTHVDMPTIDVRPACSVELSADRPFRVFADGDPIGALPCTVSVRPASLRVLLPTLGGPP